FDLLVIICSTSATALSIQNRLCIAAATVDRSAPKKRPLGRQQSFRSGLIGNEPVEQSPSERREDGGQLGRPEGRADGQRGRGNLQGNAGHAFVGTTIQDLACRAERPANDLANGPEAHELQQLLTTDETVDMELRAGIDLTNTDEAQVGLLGHGANTAD